MYECQFPESEKLYMRRTFKKGERKEALAEAEEDNNNNNNNNNNNKGMITAS